MIKTIHKFTNNNTKFIYYFILSAFAYVYLFYVLETSLDKLINASLSILFAFFLFKKLSKTKKIYTWWVFVLGYFVIFSLYHLMQIYFIFIVNDPNLDSIYIQILYIISLFCILLVVFNILVKMIENAANNQILLDITISSVIIIGFVLFIIFDFFSCKDKDNIHCFFNVMFVFLEILIFCGSLILFTSISKNKSNLSLLILLMSFCLYSVYDILHFFEIGMYVTQNELLNKFLYNFGINIIQFLIFVSSFYLEFDLENHNLVNNEDYLNENFLRKTKALIFIPIIIVIALYKFDFIWISFFCLLVLAHMILTYHTSVTSYNKILLQKEKTMHKELNDTLKIKLKQLNERNRHLIELGKNDYLTKALNRSNFVHNFSEMLKIKDIGECVNLYAIDLNHFKLVCNTYGYYVGDMAIVHVVATLRKILPNKHSIIGRFGGDEIFIAIKQKINKNDYKEFANKILETIKKPFLIENHRIMLDAKIGINCSSNSEINSSDIISQAEIALSLAKSNSQKSFVVYDDEINKMIQEKLYIENLLNQADFDKEFKLNFQPQYSLKDKKLIGAEALLRWHSPLKGFISPGRFIPVAEQSLLINKIGLWVMRKAMQTMSLINKKYNKELKIGINVSPRQIDSINFSNNVFMIAKEFDMNTNLIDIEITEMSIIETESVIQAVFDNFEKKGISISIDDFGTGFSSLNYIKKYNINKLKIAKELIDDIAIDKKDRDVVKAIISLAKTMNLKTIAEGVEYDNQLEILRELGCDQIQGYIWGKPLPQEDFESLVSSLDQK